MHSVPAVVAILLLVGCATPGGVQKAKQSQKGDALVTMSGFEFVPRMVTIKAGQTVEWNNTDALETHTVTDDPKLARSPSDVALPSGAAAFNSGDLKPGKTFVQKFDVPGTYRYFCQPHAGMGMVGEVVVAPK